MVKKKLDEVHCGAPQGNQNAVKEVTMDKNINFRIFEEDRGKLKIASIMEGQKNYTDWCREILIKKADEIIKENPRKANKIKKEL